MIEKIWSELNSSKINLQILKLGGYKEIIFNVSGQDVYGHAIAWCPRQTPSNDFSFKISIILNKFSCSFGKPGPVSYLWDFRDGFISTQQNPCHTYGDLSTLVSRN